MSLGDKTLQAIQEIKQILEKHGKNGWLRLKECEKLFVKLNPHEKSLTRHRRFYRLVKQIDNGKITDLQHIKLGDYAWIGLKEADPSTLKAKPSLIKQYLMRRLWQEEREIEREWHSGDQFKAYDKAFALGLKLWKPYKKQFFEALKTVNQKLEMIAFIYRGSEPKYFIRAKQANYLRTVGNPTLIEKICSILHKMEEEYSPD